MRVASCSNPVLSGEEADAIFDDSSVRFGLVFGFVVIVIRV